MDGKGWPRFLAGMWLAFLAGCGGVEEQTPGPLPASAAEGDGAAAQVPSPGLEVAPVRLERDSGRPRPPPPSTLRSFQPGFHQALRWSESTRGWTTFRLRVPVGRAGERVRLAFRSGDGALRLERATLARAGTEGALASEPVPVTFSGAPGFSVGARTRVVSDPLPFPVGFGDEVAVSFEVEGALAASAIQALPGSYARAGRYADARAALGGAPWPRAVGLATVELEGPTTQAFVALGDSITEGYITGHDDTRAAWPALAGAQLRLPMVNAGVSGQGFYAALLHLDAEVLALPGITDCLVLLGTNDLGAHTVEELQQRMSTLLQRLRPFCRPWVSTLLPKEKSNHGNYEAVKERRLAFNAWLRRTQPDLLDLEAVTRSPGSVHLFRDGLDVDGIHPSAEGHRVMAAEVARRLRESGGGAPSTPPGAARP